MKQNYKIISKIIGDNLKVSLINQMIDILQIDEKSTVLDVGCGTGGDAYYLSKKSGALVVGIDNNLEVIGYSSKIIPVINFDILSHPLPLADSTFSHIFCLNFIHLIDDKALFFKEVYRLLKDDGKFLILITTPEQIKSRYINKYFPSLCSIEMKRHEFSPKLTEYLKDVGFINVTEKSIEIDPYVINFDYYHRLKAGILSSLLLLDDKERYDGLKNLKKDIQSFSLTHKFPSFRKMRSVLISFKNTN